MLFPERMHRVVWLVAQERLPEALGQLARFGDFHVAEHRHVPSSFEISELLSRRYVYQQYLLASRAWRLLQQLPSSPLLNYAAGLLPPSQIAACRKAGAWIDEDGVFFWAGAGRQPEALAQYALKGPPQEPPPPIDLPESLWQQVAGLEGRLACAGGWVVLDGWVPASRSDKLAAKLRQEPCAITAAEECGVDFGEVPVRVQRPHWLGAFAWLADKYGIPAYRELDPVWFFAAGFVLLFGLMFADLGQGLLLAIAGVLLLHSRGAKRPGYRLSAGFLIPIGLSAALFGILFGSCFAREDLVPALWFQPLQAAPFYLAASIGMGAAILLLGIGLHLINAWRLRRLRQAVWDHYGLVGLFFYAGLVGATAAYLADHGAWAVCGLLLAGSALLLFMTNAFLSERSQPLGLRLLLSLIKGYEVAGRYFVQTLSFARIAAFTLAHIGLSKALVMLTDLLAPWPVLAWSLFIVGNLGIVVLEGVIVCVQVLRLHFYEFFSKFVIDGGYAYAPLRDKGGGHAEMVGET